MTSTDPDALRLRLLAARRDRMARNGDLSRTIAALHRIADDLDADNQRTAAERALQRQRNGGPRKGDPLGYGWGMIDRLIVRACAGTSAEFGAEWARLCDEKDLAAAKAFGEEVTKSQQAVRQAIADHAPAHTSGDDPLQPQELRSIADRLARQAMPLPTDHSEESQ